MDGALGSESERGQHESRNPYLSLSTRICCNSEYQNLIPGAALGNNHIGVLVFFLLKY